MLMKYVKNKLLKETQEIPIDDMEDFPIYNFDEEYNDVELEDQFQDQGSEDLIELQENKSIKKKNSMLDKKKHLQELNDNIEYLYD